MVALGSFKKDGITHGDALVRREKKSNFSTTHTLVRILLLNFCLFFFFFLNIFCFGWHKKKTKTKKYLLFTYLFTNEKKIYNFFGFLYGFLLLKCKAYNLQKEKKKIKTFQLNSFNLRSSHL